MCVRVYKGNHKAVYSVVLDEGEHRSLSALMRVAVSVPIVKHYGVS